MPNRPGVSLSSLRVVVAGPVTLVMSPVFGLTAVGLTT